MSHLYLVYVLKPDIKPTYSVSTIAGKSANEAHAATTEHSAASAKNSNAKIFYGYLKLLDITYFGENDPRNKATLENLLTSQHQDYTLNSALPYGGKLTQVMKDRIVITKEGQNKTIGLLESLDNREDRKTLMIKGYKKVTPNEWLIMPDHLHVEKNVHDDLLTTEISPHFIKGKQRFVLDIFPEGGLFSKLGFQAGDIVVTIDGEELTDIQHILRICWKIRNSSLIKVVLERHHKPVNLSYRLVSENDNS